MLPRTREKNITPFSFKKLTITNQKHPHTYPFGERERERERDGERGEKENERERERAAPEREDSQRSFFFFPVPSSSCNNFTPKRSRHEKINGKGLSSGAVYIYICFHRFTSSRALSRDSRNSPSPRSFSKRGTGSRRPPCPPRQGPERPSTPRYGACARRPRRRRFSCCCWCGAFAVAVALRPFSFSFLLIRPFLFFATSSSASPPWRRPRLRAPAAASRGPQPAPREEAGVGSQRRGRVSFLVFLRSFLFLLRPLLRVSKQEEQRQLLSSSKLLLLHSRHCLLDGRHRHAHGPLGHDQPRRTKQQEPVLAVEVDPR